MRQDKRHLPTCKEARSAVALARYHSCIHRPVRWSAFRFWSPKVSTKAVCLESVSLLPRFDLESQASSYDTNLTFSGKDQALAPSWWTCSNRKKADIKTTCPKFPSQKFPANDVWLELGPGSLNRADMPYLYYSTNLHGPAISSTVACSDNIPSMIRLPWLLPSSKRLRTGVPSREALHGSQVCTVTPLVGPAMLHLDHLQDPHLDQSPSDKSSGTKKPWTRMNNIVAQFTEPVLSSSVCLQA